MQRLLRIIAFVLVLGSQLLPTAVLADSDAPPYLLNPLKCDDFLCLVTQIVRFLLAGVAMISTLIFIYGGFVFILSGGNPEQVKKGKDILFWATIGLVVVIGSWVIVQFVLKSLVGVTKG